MKKIALSVAVALLAHSPLVLAVGEKYQVGNYEVTADSIDVITPTEIYAKGHVTISTHRGDLLVEEAALRELGNIIEIEVDASRWGARQYIERFDVKSLEGARASGGEMRLEREGFRLVLSKGLIATWWNKALNVCAQVLTSNGRYKKVTAISSEQCDIKQ